MFLDKCNRRNLNAYVIFCLEEKFLASVWPVETTTKIRLLNFVFIAILDSPLKHIERMHEDFELESLSERKTTLPSNLSLGFYDILTKKT